MKRIVLFLILCVLATQAYADNETTVDGRTGKGHVIYDESTKIKQREAMSFAGAGVSVADTNGKTVVTIAGGGSGHTIQEEGSNLTARTNLNFVGSTVTASDGGAGPDSTIVTITGGGLTWNEVTGTSQSAAVNNGYLTNNAALVTVTIPTAASTGSTVAVAGIGAGGWKIAQNASEIIHFGNQDTTTGAGGSLASTHRRDAVTLVCVVADTEWTVTDSVGNITVV